MSVETAQVRKGCLNEVDNAAKGLDLKTRLVRMRHDV